MIDLIINVALPVIMVCSIMSFADKYLFKDKPEDKSETKDEDK